MSSKILTIEEACQYMDLPVERYAVGQTVVLTSNYSGGLNLINPRIIGYSTNNTGLNEELQEKGYRNQELYQVEGDNGLRTVLWPEEVRKTNNNGGENV